MKRFFPALFICCVALVPLHAEPFGNSLEVMPVAGWKSADPLAPGQAPSPFPILKFVPEDGHNAAIYLTLVPANVPGHEITDLEALKRFNFNVSKSYLPPDPTVALPVTELKVPGGIGVAVTSEDPALVGKPVPPNEFRVVTCASILLDGQYLVHASICYDELDSRDAKDGLKILLSTTPKTSSPSI